MLKSFSIAAAAAALMTNSALAAPSGATPSAPAPSQVAAPEEGITGQLLWNSTSSPVLLFLLVVAIGTGIALLTKSHDKPASP
ncbi:MAG TPA: hypothetical protein VJ859_14865 [Allosphingosinicella sp.]|nr:hypothetical protein [Allosphingosinicella sp.]